MQSDHIAEASRNILVVCIATTKKHDLAPDDVNVAGTYQLNLALDKGTSDGEVHEIALENFHNSVAISVLDDFDIRVFDAQTKQEIEYDGDYDICEKVSCYKISDDVPAWVKRHYRKNISSDFMFEP